MGDYYQNRAQLTRYLGRGVIQTSGKAMHPVAQSLKKIPEYHSQNNFFMRDFENALLSLLVKNLDEIASYDQGTLKKLIGVLKNCNQDTYFGARLEVSVCASLVRAKISFEKTEHPDFTLQGEFLGTNLECTSAHLSKPKDGDLDYKIVSAINEKSGFDYATRCTALFVDFTNINFHSMSHGGPSKIRSGNELKKYLQMSVASSGYGSILVWTTMANLDMTPYRYQWKYTRIDNKPSRTLSSFLDKIYPLGEDRTHSYDFSLIP